MDIINFVGYEGSDAMSMNTLKYLRLLVPGILVLIIFILAIQDGFDELVDLGKTLSNLQFKDGLYIAIFIVLGALYYIFNIRDLLWNPYHKRVQSNIKETLINPFREELNQQQRDTLKEGRKLMNVFYYFIDNDNSLAQKANRVRFNGLIWTSTIDLTIITATGSLVFWVKTIMEMNSYSLWMAVILLIIAFISFGLIQLTTRKHLSLSNEQLEIICQLHKEKLHEKINELLQN